MSAFRLIPCKISRGGFSSERTFEISLQSGETFVGISYVAHLLTEDHQPLGDDVPPMGQTIDGLVKCRVIRKTGDETVLIDLPSSEVICVQENELQELAAC